MTTRLISLVGPVASGKTTLAWRLAEALQAALVLEDFQGNPFLADAYAGRDDLRLASQTYYLLSRVGQLAGLPALGRPLAVSDYAFLQDAVFARIWLAGEEWSIYRELAGRLERLVPAADVLVHLDGPAELLLERIARRGRAFERSMQAEFLERLREDYNAALARAVCPVLNVNVAACDLNDERQFGRLLDEVRAALEAGRR